MVTPLPSLTVVTGADAGRIIPLREGETTIGRSAGCLCRLDDLSVGRLHAIVAGAGGRWTLLDQADADSTSVNGRPVVQAEIHDGDEIGIGGVILRFQYSPAPASRPENRAWLSAGIPVVAVILAGIALLAALGTFRRTEEPAPIENPRMVAEAGADMDTDLSLDDGASLLIPAGGLAEGSAVSIGRVPASEREFSIPDGLELGNVYEVEAEGDLWSMAGANITLPVDIQGLTQDEYEDFQVAYYADGKWIGLPSTVNVEAGTVSAGTSHFSLFAVIRRLFDKEPEVTVLTQPVAYSDVPLEKTMDVDLDDLVTVIYVFDPEDQPVDVYFTYALGTESSWAVGEMNAQRQEMANHLTAELNSIGIVEGFPAVGAFGEWVGDALSPPNTSREILAPGWFQLHEIRPGTYVAPLRLRGLELESPLRQVHVYVRVEDAVKDAPTEVDRVIPVTQQAVPDAPVLVEPGPSTSTVCPPEPIYRWSWPGSFIDQRSLRLRVVKGSDVWGAAFPIVDRIVREGEDGFSELDWTQNQPLRDGMYSWAIAVSSREDENQFRPPLSSRSNTFQFTVDGSLLGHECLSPGQERGFPFNLTVDTAKVVWREGPVESEALPDLRWDLVLDGGSRFDLPAMESRLAMVGGRDFSASPGTYTVQLTAVVGDSRQPVSNSVEVEIVAPSATVSVQGTQVVVNAFASDVEVYDEYWIALGPQGETRMHMAPGGNRLDVTGLPGGRYTVWLAADYGTERGVPISNRITVDAVGGDATPEWTPTSTQTPVPDASRTWTGTPAPEVAPVTPTETPACPQIPDVTNMTPQDAQNVLESAGFGLTFDQGHYADDRFGLVVKQEPPAYSCGSPADTMIMFYVNLPDTNPWIDADPCDVLVALYDAKSREDLDAEMAVPRATPLSAEEQKEQRDYLAWYYNEYDVQYRDVLCQKRTPDPQDRNTEYVLVQYAVDFQKPDRPPETNVALMEMVFKGGQWTLGGAAPVFKGAPAAPFNLSPADNTAAFCSDFAGKDSVRFSWEGAIVPEDQPRFDYAQDFPVDDADLLHMSQIEIWAQNMGESEFSLVERSDFFTFSATEPVVYFDFPADDVPVHSPEVLVKWRVVFVNNLFETPRVESPWHTLDLDCVPRSQASPGDRRRVCSAA